MVSAAGPRITRHRQQRYNEDISTVDSDKLRDIIYEDSSYSRQVIRLAIEVLGKKINVSRETLARVELTGVSRPTGALPVIPNRNTQEG